MSKIEPVGHAVAMTGTNGGYSMYAWKSSDVPVGTALYIEDPKQAERIKRLEEALSLIADIEPDPDNMHRFHDIANAALEEKP